MVMSCGIAWGKSHQELHLIRLLSWNLKKAYLRNPFINAGAIVTGDAYTVAYRLLCILCLKHFGLYRGIGV